MKRPHIVYYLALLLAVSLLGSAFPITTIGLQYIDPMWLAFFRVATAFILITLILSFKNKLRIPPKADWFAAFFVGALQIGLFLVILNISLVFTLSGRSSVLVGTLSLWVTPIAVLFFHERISFSKVLGLSLGLSGIMLLFAPWEINWSDKNSLIGSLLSIAAAWCWAVSVLIIRYHKWQAPPITLLPWQLLIACVITIIPALIWGDWYAIKWSVTLLNVIFYLGMLATLLGFGIIIFLGQKLSAINLSLGLLAIPVFGLLSSAVLLGEQLTLTTSIATGLIMTGLILIVMSNKPNFKC